eukprot:TRINITY_DN15295_c0_g1_i1.p1 TRINITY_DN15295_c0_g1~~TRINITY_DN15295_c0_g1_i1.p1  ORF type:complete len:102 (-),score=21.35 TRINITY_DN15295_c0_g1_i1:46-351(-)
MNTEKLKKFLHQNPYIKKGISSLSFLCELDISNRTTNRKSKYNKRHVVVTTFEFLTVDESPKGYSVKDVCPLLKLSSMEQKENQVHLTCNITDGQACPGIS